MSYPVRYVGPELTAAQLDAIEHESSRLVRRDPVNGIYTIVSGVKSAQEKREQHTREAPSSMSIAQIRCKTLLLEYIAEQRKMFIEVEKLLGNT